MKHISTKFMALAKYRWSNNDISKRKLNYFADSYKVNFREWYLQSNGGLNFTTA